jgi:excisionase family DNA binding protein
VSELIGTKEAAKILGVSEVTIWRRVRDGKLEPSSKIGKQAVFTREYIESLKKQVEVAA